MSRLGAYEAAKVIVSSSPKLLHPTNCEDLEAASKTITKLKQLATAVAPRPAELLWQRFRQFSAA